MKVSDNFPVLQKQNSLLIAAGKQAAKIYRLGKGEINTRDTIEIPNPQYSDREGHFEYRGPRGTLHGSGAVYEAKEQYIRQKFLSRLVRELKNVRRPYKNIYLFAPKEILRDIVRTLPQNIQQKIRRTFSGNYTKHSPLALLTKIQARRKAMAQRLAQSRASAQVQRILKLKPGTALPLQPGLG